MPQPDAHAEVRRLLGELRSQVVARDPRGLARFDEKSDQIETITRAYMTPGYDDEWSGVRFEPQELRIANLLKARLGHTVTHEAIMNALYFDQPEEPEYAQKSRHVRIFSIRKKLKGYRIENVHGIGYRMSERH